MNKKKRSVLLPILKSVVQFRSTFHVCLIFGLHISRFEHDISPHPITEVCLFHNNCAFEANLVPNRLTFEKEICVNLLEDL